MIRSDKDLPPLKFNVINQIQRKLVRLYKCQSIPLKSQSHFLTLKQAKKFYRMTNIDDEKFCPPLDRRSILTSVIKEIGWNYGRISRSDHLDEEFLYLQISWMHHILKIWWVFWMSLSHKHVAEISELRFLPRFWRNSAYLIIIVIDFIYFT